MRFAFTTLFILLTCCGTALAEPGKAPTPEAIEFFEKHVRPVLAENCWSCHGEKQQKASLRLDSRDAVLKGSDTGPVVIASQSEKSLLVQAIRQTGDLKMPPKGRLKDEQIAALSRWIQEGVAWPVSRETLANAAWEKHWAFQPVRVPGLPRVRDAGWCQSSIDFFVRAKLEASGLGPAPQAERRNWVRRVSYDLVGLPPSPEEIDAFVQDASPDAAVRVVDRLLASPQFGERWGRYWLDVARYANERGYVGVDVDRVYPFAYTYRDWVINAFNEDRPYDQFLIAQLAADQLPLGENKRDLAAMGFLTVGRRFINNQQDIIDDRIDVTLRGMQGLTVTCARCHDHKFDPIPTKDYYSLYGVFASSQEPDDLPILEPISRGPALDAFEKELQRLTEEKAKFERENEAMKKDKPREFKEKIKPFDNKIKQLHAKHPGAPPRGMVLIDLPQPVQPRVFVRGNAGNPGPEVPRQFLGLLTGTERRPFTKGSGRLELAQAIVSKDNPLTARVFVNRVWGHLFGEGLVLTPSDFGLRSEPPSHPELLDHLASEFVADGWSVKNLIRRIVLSSTYRQSSDGAAAGLQRDPENRLLWKMNRRRLDFEALRDSLLAVSGDLDPTLGGQAIDLAKQPFSKRRTVYGFIDRQNLPPMFRTFDFANPDTHSPQRHETVVPQQALFLMNSPFVLERARRLTARLETAGVTEPAARVQHLHRLLFGREATPAETQQGLAYVQAVEADGKSTKLAAWEQYAQVLLLTNEFVFVD